MKYNESDIKLAALANIDALRKQVLEQYVIVHAEEDAWWAKNGDQFNINIPGDFAELMTLVAKNSPQAWDILEGQFNVLFPGKHILLDGFWREFPIPSDNEAGFESLAFPSVVVNVHRHDGIDQVALAADLERMFALIPAALQSERIISFGSDGTFNQYVTKYDGEADGFVLKDEYVDSTRLHSDLLALIAGKVKQLKERDSMLGKYDDRRDDW